MPPCKLKLIPPSDALKNSPPLVLLRTIRRPLAISAPRQCLLTFRRFEGENRAFSTSRAMTSDAGYATFMQKLLKERLKQGDEAPLITILRATDARAHPALDALRERYYTSDVDEPFESVSFDWEGERLPGEGEFAELIGAPGQEVTRLEPGRWDMRGEYHDVVDAVTKAVNGGAVKVYRVEGSGTTVEFFIVGVERSAWRIVGVKVLSVES